MTIRIDPDLLRSIASSCGTSAANIEREAQAMNTKVQQLRDALSGINTVRLEDRFAEWNRLFKQLSEAMHESDAFLKSIASRIEQIITDLNH